MKIVNFVAAAGVLALIAFVRTLASDNRAILDNLRKVDWDEHERWRQDLRAIDNNCYIIGSMEMIAGVLATILVLNALSDCVWRYERRRSVAVQSERK